MLHSCKYLLYTWRNFPPPLASMVLAVRSSFPFQKWFVVVISVAQLNSLIRVGCHKCWAPCLWQIRLFRTENMQNCWVLWISWLASILKIKQVKVVWNNAKTKSSPSARSQFVKILEHHKDERKILKVKITPSPALLVWILHFCWIWPGRAARTLLLMHGPYFVYF